MEEKKKVKASSLLGNSKKIKKTPIPKKNKAEDIDGIFDSIKGKPKRKPQVTEENPKEETKKKIPREKKKNTENGKYTEEGYKIYSMEELKLGQGGDTSLCPFDCDCCY